MGRKGSPKITAIAATIALAAATAATGAAPAVADQDDPSVTIPDNVRADVGASSVTVEWDPSTSDSDIAIYYVKLDGRWLRTVEPTMTFHLEKSRTYTLTVQAQDEAYNLSDWSDPFKFTTPDEFPVTTPANVQVSGSPGSVTVQWDRAASDAGMLDYVAILSGGRTGPIAKRTFDPTTTTTFSYPPGGDLKVTVQAHDKAYRWSDTSDPVEITLAPADDWEPPSTPTNFRAADSQDGVLFEWDEPAEGVGPFTYDISLDGNETDAIRDDLQLDSPYFAECTHDWQTRADFTITATSYGFTSAPSDPITLCFA